MNNDIRRAVKITRRNWLQAASAGIGWLAYSAFAYANPGTAHKSKARNIIFCFMDGGPSHVDTFDPKPSLKKYQGVKIGETAVSVRSQSDANRVWLGSPWQFRQHGESGLWISELFPRISSVADRLCVVRSLVGELPLHGQQNLLLHTGRILGQAPSMGAWINYGLASENENLPGYVVLNNDWVPNGGLENFGSSYLPASNQATLIRATGPAVDNLTPTMNDSEQGKLLVFLDEQDHHFANLVSQPDVIQAAIANYEIAYRMQREVPELLDISKETEYTQRLYGINSSDEHQKLYATQALRARRLIEAGVRFVEITCPSFDGNNSPWDQHGQLKTNHEKNARVTEQSVAALIIDLEQRGLLEETIVLWAGEMGRTPHTPAIHDGCGRDHHVDGYSIFMAGGGFRGGMTYGETDDFGNSVIKDRCDIHDIHATILHQLGIDHQSLTFRHGGRDHRLTDVHGKVIHDLLL